MRPLMSLPSATVRGDAELWNSSDSKICRRLMTSRREFGTSMPTVGFPGMRSIRIDSACKPRHRSSVSVVMREYFTPASGLNSKVVTTGPGLICVTLPRTLNSSNLALIASAVSFNSRLSNSVRSGGSCSRLVGGILNAERCLRGSAGADFAELLREISTGSGGASSNGAGSGGSSSSVRIGISSISATASRSITFGTNGGLIGSLISG